MRLLRETALSRKGPLAATIFLTGGAIVAKIATGNVGAAVSDVTAGLLGNSAGDWLSSAVKGFLDDESEDLEKSMTAAAQRALKTLEPEAPGFSAWFQAWDRYLGAAHPADIFRGVGPLEPSAQDFTDSRFHDYWWEQMELALLRWADHGRQGTDLNLDGFTEPLRTVLRTRFPEALDAAHLAVLRKAEFRESRIAFEQDFMIEARRDLRVIKANTGGSQQPQRLWTIPRPTHTFQDRPELLQAISDALSQGVTALTALHGLGGIGKSQMARRYADLNHDLYTAGVWINSETEPSLLASLSEIARDHLGLPEEKNQEALAKRTIGMLSQYEPWLVIFDNATSAAEIRPWVELLSGNGHVLITSRSESWQGVAQPVSVTTWDIEKEAVPFLLKQTRQTDHAAAAAVATDLDGLILALDHAVAFMNAGEGLHLAEYRKVWQKRLAKSIDGHGYKKSVAATLGLSLDAVAKESPLAYQLLSIFAWLAPDPIPRKELLEAGAEKLPEGLRNALADHEAWTELIDALRRYSLLPFAFDRNGKVTGYNVHRVLRQVLRDRMTEEESVQNLTAACDLVSEAFPYDSDEPQFWPASEALLPHARAIRQAVEESSPPASLGRLLNQAALYLRVRGLYHEARDFQTLALTADVRQFGEDHPKVAVRRSNLATILSALGEHEEARKQIEMALAADVRQFGEDHPNVARCRSNLAVILSDLGEHEEARKQIELALAAAVRQFGEDHPNVAIRRSNLANILSALGEHQEARKQIELALAADVRRFGEDHPNVAVHRSNLANILRDLGEHEEARKQIELALASDVQQFGEDHPTVAVDRSNLANILGDLGEHEEARKEIELALDADVRQFGEDHPEVAIYRSNLANILRDLGEHEEARKQIELALASDVRQFGEDHPAVATSRNNLAHVLYALGDYQGALREIDKALDIFCRKLPPEHPYIGTVTATREAILKRLQP